MDITRFQVVSLFTFIVVIVVGVTKAQEEVVCRTCECNRDLKTIRCNDRGLRFVPDLTWANAGVFSTIDLRGNEITFVDFNRLVKFRVINIQNNPISCTHGLINVRSITIHNILYIDCKIPGVKRWRTPDPRDFITHHTPQTPTDEPEHQTTIEFDPKTIDTMIAAAGAYGKADAFTKGKFELAWGLSTSLTICGLIGGLITCYTLSKLMQKIKHLDMKLKRHEDFEAPRPNTPPRSLFDDITEGISQAFSANRSRNSGKNRI